MAVLTGIENLEEALRRLERTIQAKALMSALKENVEPTRARAAELAPVLTGRLAAHEDIATVPSLSSSKVAVVRVGPRIDAFYGLFDELGTAFMIPQPFLLPAYEETKDTVLAKTAESFKKAVESISTIRTPKP